MKSLEKNAVLLYWLSTGILMVAFIVLSLSSCQKDELLTIPSQSEKQMTSDASLTLATDPSNAGEAPKQIAGIVHPDIFNVIRIDHHGARSFLPDYTVTVRSDGVVIYEGRNHVRVRDRVVYHLSGVTLDVLNEIFRSNHFYQIRSFTDLQADQPYVETTYQPTLLIRAHAIVDNYESRPAEMIAIRKQIEELIGVYKYVNYNSPFGLDVFLTPAEI